MNTGDKKDINKYLEQKPKDMQQIVRRIMEIILKNHQGMATEMRWGKPTFAINNDFHHWICAIQVLKKGVALIFHFGGLLNDEENRLIAGTSRFLRKLEYDSLSSIDEEEIRAFIGQVIEKLPYFKEHWKELNAEWRQKE